MEDKLEELKSFIESFMQMLYENGYELNDDGEIVESETMKLTFDFGSDKYE